MNNYVEWVEPFGPGEPFGCPRPVVKKMTVDDAIAVQKAFVRASLNPSYEYQSDEEALADFVAVHWAEVKEGT